MGVATGCGCKEVYRFPHTIYLSLLLLLLYLFFFTAASLLFVHFLKCFSFLYIYYTATIALYTLPLNTFTRLNIKIPPKLLHYENHI